MALRRLWLSGIATSTVLCVIPWWFCQYNYAWSVIMDGSISRYGPVIVYLIVGVTYHIIIIIIIIIAVEVARLEQKKGNGVKLISLLRKNPVENIFAPVGPLEMSTRTHEGRPPVNYLSPLPTLRTSSTNITKDTEDRSPQKRIQQFPCCQAHFCVCWSQTRAKKNNTYLEIFEDCDVGQAQRHFGHHFLSREALVPLSTTEIGTQLIAHFLRYHAAVPLHCDRSQVTWQYLPTGVVFQNLTVAQLVKILSSYKPSVQ